MSLAQLEALYNAAVSAFDADDYASALQAALKLQFRIASMPDVEQDLGQGGRRKLSFNSRDVSALISTCRQLLNDATAAASIAANGMIQQSQVVYQRPGTTGDFS